MGDDTKASDCAAPGAKEDTSMSEGAVGMVIEASRVLVILSMASVRVLSISGKAAEVGETDSVRAIERSVRVAVALSPIVSISVGSPLKISARLVVGI